MTRGELLDVAATVAWRFCANRSYGQERDRAIKAIRRKCPGFSRKQYENAFNAAVSLYSRVYPFVKEHADTLWAASNTGDEQGTKLLIQQLHKEFPAFWISSIRMMVGMNFYYWHLR